MWLSVVVCSGLGTTAFCFLGHAGLLEYAGVEEKTAGEGGERADGGTGGQFTSEHQAHSAGPEGPDEPSQQSGIHSVLTETHPHFVLFLAQAKTLKEMTPRPDKTCFAFFSR